ncbi:tRNA lysidine(34) synthetase TilS [Brevibacillus ruminantium]|uniref:tRNA(Ile)-lysidine synthase n=1 Tax=Brevibacillus ruminantium TaxID=2950604 RepID=A0ABY4WFJ6_9BACL|nr:tRNA lysidine(34) synthetase TilS [Brevibacillus ruminantium]USG65931.1 tRNA lysidine(34) synthetase TilS [Brevibacillus ruminantium]
MLESVRNNIESQHLLGPGESIVVGISGGNDSTALLHILWALNSHYQYGWTLHAVHLNHGFRGEEAKEDAKYAEELCRELGIAFHLFERSIPEVMKETGMGPQEASRAVRYDLYKQVALKVKASKIAVAHHADDQVETILFRLVRGTRLSGLAGMPARRWLVENQVELVRPLLSVSRAELEQYCRDAGLSPREDSSNRSRKYARNLIRLEVMPLLGQINERYAEHILSLSRAAQEDEAYLQKQSRERLEAVILEQKPGKVAIDADKFQSCDVALQRRMITLILNYLSRQIEWSSQHVEAVLHMIEGIRPSAELNFPSGISVVRVYGQVRFQMEEEQLHSSFFCYKLAVPGMTLVPESGASVHMFYRDGPIDWARLPDDAAVFDADRLPGPLFVRSRKSGDRMTLWGTAGSKKLKDLLIDAKVPQRWRDKMPIVTAGDQVVWVPGIRRSAIAPVNEWTKRVLYVEVEFGEEWREVLK